MLPVNSDGHSAYQNFVVEMLRKYYPNPDASLILHETSLTVSGTLIFPIPIPL